MFSLIEIWKESGKTQLEFCKEKDIAYSKFHYWLKRYNADRRTPDESPAFMAVTLKNQSVVPAGILELVYPDGRRLIFPQDVDPSFVRALLA
ncbi:MAG TPA: hypothetical protein VFT90_06465 [Chryseosolibacter sp.]|nr:hypothetical protein [Chryseosolibacter sp.]